MPFPAINISTGLGPDRARSLKDRKTGSLGRRYKLGMGRLKFRPEIDGSYRGDTEPGGDGLPEVRQ
ncbi:MAG: hypothetical protein JO337_04770 [Acidimicrobiales bacterium]|nr:hypothetical protein [Acidimicrobiales bacterium]